MTGGVTRASAEGHEQKPRSWASAQWGHLLDDVFRRPTVGPVASWLILSLVTLVGWLTAQYAPSAVTGAACGAAAQQATDGSGIIPVNAGYGTVVAVMAITFLAGMQPVLEKRFTSDWSGQLSDWFARQSLMLRAPVILVSRVLSFLFRVPAWVLSFADYLLARPLALIAGAGLSPCWLRYGLFLSWMAAAIVAAWLLPAPLGLWGFFGGVVLVIGIVRRWNWVEADREAFFVARRQRPPNERIGFAEDLRDEALVALVFLFVLIPLGLRQVELMRPETFCINGASGADAGVLAWLGFFGAELAKSVPFVDWSEVFHVANGSPIEPNTVLGAQVVFAMRATLDLVMISAVVQAVQLASRLAEQNTAFDAGDIDILEPFVERSRLHALGLALDRAGDGKVIEQPAIREFPAYSPDRLQQIVEGAGARRPVQALGDTRARRAALALAVKQAAMAGQPDKVRPLIYRAAAETMAANRRLAMRLAWECDPTALMAPAYERASTIQAEGGPVDINALLEDHSEQARSLARRAIRSALGELDVMVNIPAGTFTMGTRHGEAGASKVEHPENEVQIGAFALGKYPVTFDEYASFCEATGLASPIDRGWGRGNRPVIEVSWHDAIAYITWLNSWSGGRFRLPSEAEWEYACRAGSTTHWSFGDDETLLGDYAWFGENAEGHTHPVGEKLANAFGLYDMHGNVWEWCEDTWHDSNEHAPADGSAWIAGGDDSLRVLRGGSWGDDNPQYLRSANRGKNNPTLRGNGFGFRLASAIIAP